LPWNEVIDIGSNLADALDAAHAAGVLHRDVKPDNVLISTYGAPMLADFGIARFADSAHTQTGQVTASIAHAAPEVLDGKPPSAQSDIYSLSSTLFEALSGKGPFVRDTDESVYALIARIGREDPPDLRRQGIPGGVCAVLERGLAKDPQHRFASAEDFGNALRDAKAGRAPAKTVPIEVRLQDPEGVSPKRSRRRGLVAGGGAFAGVLLIAASALLVTRDGDNGGRATRSAMVTTEATTTAPTTTVPAADDPLSYYTTDGSQPPLLPDCNGVFGLCLGSPIDAATQRFGLESTRYDGLVGLARVWEVGPIRLIIEADDVGSIASITATISGTETVALGLPERLTLGESTVDDVKDQLRSQLGEPFGTDTVAGENIVIYITCYRSGAEGSELLEFSYGTEMGSPSDPGGFNAALDASPVTSFSVERAVDNPGCGAS
jgi:hypothetical protein